MRSRALSATGWTWASSRSRLCAVMAAVIAFASCGGPESGNKKTEAKKAAPAKPPEKFRVKLATAKGDIVIEVDRALAPFGADRFHELVTAKFYDGARFHRVMKGFIAQFGYNADPKTQQLWSMARIPDDPPNKQRNKRGTVAFAKLDANSRTTQVFINLRDNPVLDQTGFVVIGRVAEGMEVADKLAYVYGELAPRGSGPDPTRIATEGEGYLRRMFPRLDTITAATVVAP